MLLRLSYWFNNVIVRWQLLVTVVVIWGVSLWLKSNYSDDESNLWLVMNVFLVVIRWTVIGLFAISLLFTLIVWLLFLYNVRNKKISIQVQFGEGQRAEAGFVPLTIILNGPAIRPLLGTIQGRLVFAGKKLSDSIILDTDIFKKRSVSRLAIKGTGKTLLHDRGIYDVEKVHIVFCDMFNLIALPHTVPFTQQIYTLPKVQKESVIKAQPNTTEEQKHRIEIPKRVEGEYVNYKEFETGDNIRRIVWKIYAKSGELVVRVPETKDPYASHLYFYASFYEGFDLQNGIFDTELLNVYKDKLRNVFEALKKNEYDVRIPADQEVPKLPGMSDKKIELFQITAASWQKEKAPVAFVEPNKAAFVCMSSLVPAAEIETVLRNLPFNVPVMVVKMSDAIRSPFDIKMKNIFFRPEKQPADNLQRPWFLSPLRNKLMKNETEIQKILKQRGNASLLNANEF
jgi:hypothetical protein